MINLSSSDFLKNGKSIMSRNISHEWASDDRIGDGYLDTPLKNENRNPEDKRHEDEFKEISTLLPLKER